MARIKKDIVRGARVISIGVGPCIGCQGIGIYHVGIRKSTKNLRRTVTFQPPLCYRTLNMACPYQLILTANIVLKY
jgi:hypothetical protein